MAIIGVGNQLISSTISNNDSRVFRQISREWLIDQDEVELYDFVESHFRRFNVFPTFETLLSEGYLIDDAPDAPRYYLEQVSERYTYNLLVSKHSDLSNAIDSQDMSLAIDILREAYISVSGAGINPDILQLQQLSENVMERVAEARYSRGLIGITTGYDQLDNLTTGWLGGNVSFIVAPIKTGKTFVLMYMLLRAWMSGASIMIVSMEMPPQELVQRILAMITEINPTLLRRGEVSHFKYLDMQDTIRGFDDMPPIHFVAGDFRKSTSDIYRYANQLQPDLVGIDGAYLVDPKDKNKRSAKHESVADVANQLKADAVDLNIPYLATIQFNRQKSRKSSAGFDVNNIGGSHELGQVADYVIGMDHVENESNRRRLKLLASRSSSDDFDVKIKFEFNPPNFTYDSDFVENSGFNSQQQGTSFEEQFSEQNSN